VKTETKPYNPVRFFQTDAEIGAYLSEAFLDEDPGMFIVALGHVARHKGLAKLAEETGKASIRRCPAKPARAGISSSASSRRCTSACIWQHKATQAV
jgi:hypothetical protein